jgi:hypothetical protein
MIIEQWLDNWIRKYFKHGDHVPRPPYLLTEVFLEALKDYERERSNNKQA